MIAIFSCQKASRLLSDSFDRPLSRKEKIILAFHLSICRFCRRTRKHLKFMQTLTKGKTLSGMNLMLDEKLSTEARERIQKMIQNGE